MASQKLKWVIIGSMLVEVLTLANFIKDPKTLLYSKVVTTGTLFYAGMTELQRSKKDLEGNH